MYYIKDIEKIVLGQPMGYYIEDWILVNGSHINIFR